MKVNDNPLKKVNVPIHGAPTKDVGELKEAKTPEKIGLPKSVEGLQEDQFVLRNQAEGRDFLGIDDAVRQYQEPEPKTLDFPHEVKQFRPHEYAKIMRKGIKETVKKSPINANIKRAMVHEEIKKAPLDAQVKRAMVHEEIKKAPLDAQVKRAMVHEEIKKAPLDAQVKRAMVHEEIRKPEA